MSPAGIPIFYAGESADVVLDEVSVRTEHGSASVGKFSSTIPFRVVDLAEIPPLPSPFDRDRREQAWKIGFLRSFVERLSEPIETGRDQIDYVPTQVMSEYLLRIRWGREGVRGIRYPSAAHEGGISLVLDVSAEDCLEPGAEPDPGRLQMEFRSRDLFGARLTWTQAIQEPGDAAAVRGAGKGTA